MLIKSADDKSMRLALLDARQALWWVAVLPRALRVVCMNGLCRYLMPKSEWS